MDSPDVDRPVIREGELERRTRYLQILNALMTGFFLVAAVLAGIVAGQTSAGLGLLIIGILFASSWILGRRGNLVLGSSISILLIFAAVNVVTYLYTYEHYYESYRTATFLVAGMLLAGLIAFEKWQILALGLLNFLAVNATVWFRIVPLEGLPSGLLAAYLAQSLVIILTAVLTYLIRRFAHELLLEVRTNQELAHAKAQELQESFAKSRDGIDLSSEMVSITERSRKASAETAAGIGQIREAALKLRTDSESNAGSFHRIDEARVVLARAVSETSQRAKDARTDVEHIASETRSALSRSSSLDETLRDYARDLEDQRIRLNSVIERLQGLVNANRAMGETAEILSDIASQTHVLAMNALIVAARAGHHGDGFAVVAQEVRNLAQLSADRATEIQEMVSTSSQSAALAESATEELGNLVASIQQELATAASGFQDIRARLNSMNERGDAISSGMQALEVSASQSASHLSEVEHLLGDGARTSEALNTKLEEVMQTITSVTEGATVLASLGSELASLGSRNKAHIDDLFESLQHGCL